MDGIRVSSVREAARGAPPPRIPTGLRWLDRVTGGGLVEGTVVLLSGPPGGGKSTLLGQVAGNVPGTVYVTAEETEHQVGTRMVRIGHGRADTALVECRELDMDEVLGVCAERAPPLVILDSVQKMSVAGAKGPPGGLGQVRAVSREAVDFARMTGACVVMVCHQTKGGQFAGPRTLEHDVDAHFEVALVRGKRQFRAIKNRYGAIEAVALLEMTGRGLTCEGEPAGSWRLRARPRAPGRRGWSVPKRAAWWIVGGVGLLTCLASM